MTTSRRLNEGFHIIMYYNERIFTMRYHTFMAFAFPHTPKVILMEIYTQTYTFNLKKLLENIYWVLNV